MNRPTNRPDFDYRHGIRSYASAQPGSLEYKMPYVDYGADLVDPERYRSKEEAAREWEKMWTKVWLLAGIAADIPNPGDWFKYDIGAESFIIVRNDDGSIGACYNVCPHRGNQLVRADFGTATDCFRCAFHGWEFEKDGSLRSVKEPETFRPEALAKSEGLTRVKCDVWAGLVFISMNDDVEPLIDYLGILPSHLDRFHFEKMRVSEDTIYPHDANWKTMKDAFVEFYHADMIHPELADIMETYFCQYDVYPKGISRMILPYGYAPDKLEDDSLVNESLVTLLRSFGGDPKDWAHLKGNEYKQAVIAAKRQLAAKSGWDHFDELTDDQIVDDWNYSIFPNVTLNILGETVYIQTFTPHATDPLKSVWRGISLNVPAKDGSYQPVLVSRLGQPPEDNGHWDGSVRPPIAYPTTAEETGFTLAQDHRLIPTVQRGINSRSFKGANLCEQEIRIKHYINELDRYLSA